MIAIIDYGIGNLGSIKNMLKRAGASAVITSDIDKIQRAEKLILPGVGAFDSGMKNIHDRGLFQVLNNKVLDDKTPLLGICLGCQMITSKSEEGQLSGFGWIEAVTKKFRIEDDNNHLKVPHMGWNKVRLCKKNPLFNTNEKDIRFYFVHSYHVVCDHEEDVAMKTHYGYEFASAIMKENIIGVQFHPEKSHKFGMRLLQNWSSLSFS